MTEARNFGELGNIEIYFFLPGRNIHYYECLKDAIHAEPVCILRNIWDLDIIGKEIVFDRSLFIDPLQATEVIYLQYLIDNNLITIILLQNRIIVRISLKPWYDLAHHLKVLVSYLLNVYTLLVIGFELDFEYENGSLEKAVSTLNNYRANYPFLTRMRGKGLLENIHPIDMGIDVLNLLKEKASQVIE
jgi:hypothetical protein